MKECKYGLKIRNIKAGSLYDYNLGVRNNYDYKKAMFTNNLLLYYLKDNGLKIENGWTRDIISIDFSYGSRSYEEEKQHIENLKKNENGKYNEENMLYFDTLLEETESNKDKFDKKTKEQIRDIFYRDGVNVEYITRKKDGSIKKQEIVHYKMLYRSSGKAKQGSCMFICDRLYNKAHKFIYMGIKLPKENAPIVEISAYASLIASSITDTIKINPKNILVLEDIDSYFVTDIVSVEQGEDGHCIAKNIKDYKLSNTIFDGQALIDESKFPKWGEGYILLRHHMCKMACFKTRIQKFLKDYYKDEYQNAIMYDMWGNPHYAKDIEIITTNKAMKWLAFDISYDYWCERVYENNCMFGIVKTAHESKLGDVQKMSYQMINALDMNIMPNVVFKSKQYIEKLKKDNNAFLQYLRNNTNFSNDYEVLVALCEQNPNFVRCEYFRDRKKEIIRSYVNNFKFGKVIQDADNLVIVGSPYAMLLCAVGEDVEKDFTFATEPLAIQCFTERFADNTYLAEFRSPFNSRNNLGYLHNVYSNKFFEYFDFGKQIIAVNMIHTCFQDRNNGSDQDSDSIYVTNQSDIVAFARYCCQKYPTIVNNIPKSKNSYKLDLLSYSSIDNKLANAQLAIGQSSNLAQIAQTYMYNFNDEKYTNYVCILSVLAQCAIDSAKRSFNINISEEVGLIQKDINISVNGYPAFWKHIKDKKVKVNGIKFNEDKINKNLQCPMNYIVDLKFKDSRSSESTLPMSYFFNGVKMDKTNKRKAKRVEKFIQKYSIDLYDSLNDNDTDYLLLREDFEEMINDIQQIYISKNYLDLMSWLIERAFCIKSVSNNHYSKTLINNNRSLLLKTLYCINDKSLLKILSKNA